MVEIIQKKKEDSTNEITINITYILIKVIILSIFLNGIFANKINSFKIRKMLTNILKVLFKHLKVAISILKIV